jgi:spore germination cell wall hydrolase CwlJ-like protein
MSIIVAILALTVMAPGHAETSKELDCLAKNIFYEAGSEPEEGKAAVGIVTINRSQDPRFGNSICQVVNQKTAFVHSKEVTTVETVKVGWFGKTKDMVTTQVINTKTYVCQFSWVCGSIIKPKPMDERWAESKRVAQELMDGGYGDLLDKYSDAYYFHNTHIRPAWAKQKQKIAKVGGHIFYTD